ncbi:MAG: 3-isopropylmalate dehydrogenase [Chlorobium sp.]|uniref:3-isopropylmalate dehydrogenase n=1 Tax=Chlorobium sp. TaxID=1095 RepID=UPI0025BEA2D4|nr:3-isopropylmalate dehydrogenase [Chlorobium sp.]MCF8216937.1 3-isopropylmalate dehydrogenase [Chlorobium sp.]MCF8271766.1 3-isopropylmalate dehydrogenase [Chlorobium sp.]MCF8288154.1 3-isopropylmalate dehydrogenase [Chlorobium sp.]MCF8291745.1 3-isopropylmalate dehydrogenase [Chlorobium sp.]MCF8385837.1 3-isopropylmalate dehydrogenase [Chlorobium sp.]
MYKIVSIPGDGIGPEVVAGAVAVMNRLAEKHGFTISIEEHPFGGASYDLHGEMLTDATLEACRNCDAVLLGAVGGPKWETLPHEHKPEAALLKIRKELGLFANLRPAKVYDALVEASSLKADVVGGTDFIVFRELTGGIYFGQPRGYDENKGWNTMVYERYEVERIARLAFEAAQKRGGRLTSIDKANVLEVSQLWRNVVHEVHKDFPEIELTDMYVDNAAMQIVRNPKQFDVIVTGNLFGDILSDIAGMITGSLGMLPSASIGKSHALYEPIHGSAPDIAGQNKANPIATIASAAMMFEHSFCMPDVADAIYSAIEASLAEGLRTADIASAGQKTVSTTEMTAAIVKNLG